MQNEVVKAKDLIEESPDDYVTAGICGKCGGQMYIYRGMVTECENVIFGVGRILPSGCSNFRTGG